MMKLMSSKKPSTHAPVCRRPRRRSRSVLVVAGTAPEAAKAAQLRIAGACSPVEMVASTVLPSPARHSTSTVHGSSLVFQIAI